MSYLVIGLIVALWAATFPSEMSLVRDATGSLLLGLAWPLTAAVLGYYWIKCKVFKRPFVWSETEVALSMTFGFGLFLVYLTWSGRLAL